MKQINFDYDVDSRMWLVKENGIVTGAFKTRQEAEAFINRLKLWDAEVKAKVL